MPSLREKKRYIVFETKEKDKNKVYLVIENALKEFLGILGMSKVNPVVMKDKFKEGKGIIRFNNPYKDEVITALSLIQDFHLKTIAVSGILNKAEEYMR